MAPNYAEESREPHKIAKAATYGSVIGLGIFYIFVSYMFVTGWGLNGSAAGGQATSSTGKFASAFYPLTDKYVGSGLTTILQAADRHELVRLRDGLLQHRRALPVRARPRGRAAARARPHARQAPRPGRRRDGRVGVIVGVYMLGFTIMDPSTEAALLKLGTWTPLLGVLGILAVQGLCSVAIIRFFLTEARDGFHWFKTLVAPIVGALAMAGACYLLIANRAVLSGAGDALFIKLVPVRRAGDLRRGHGARARPAVAIARSATPPSAASAEEEIPA